MENKPWDPLTALHDLVSGKVFDAADEISDATEDTTEFVTKTGKKVKIPNGKNKVQSGNDERGRGESGSGTHHTFEFLFKPIGGGKPKSIKPKLGTDSTTEEEGEAEGEQESDESGKK